MSTRTLAHLSDLHVGRSDESDATLAAMCQTLCKRDVQHVVVTGDVTHRGRMQEWERFSDCFGPLDAQGRLTVVPGNHDRLNDDVGGHLMPDHRVMIERHPGLHLVLFDSTGPHNRNFIACHGEMSAADLEAISDAFDGAPEDSLSVLLLHHHLLPLPHDNHGERMLSWLGWGSGAELSRGRELLGRLRGRCDLILHGHRHDPVTMSLFGEDDRPLSMFNAGSSTELGHVRLFRHQQGRLVAPPMWLPVSALPPAPFFEYVTTHVAEAQNG
jgi:3',5'-cyclic AMP phosphodiesterase CpdA